MPQSHLLDGQRNKNQHSKALYRAIMSTTKVGAVSNNAANGENCLILINQLYVYCCIGQSAVNTSGDS